MRLFNFHVHRWIFSTILINEKEFTVYYLGKTSSYCLPDCLLPMRFLYAFTFLGSGLRGLFFRYAPKKAYCTTYVLRP